MKPSILEIHAQAVDFLDAFPDVAKDLTVADVCRMIAAGCDFTPKERPRRKPAPDDLVALAKEMPPRFMARDLARKWKGREPTRAELLQASRAARSVFGPPRRSNGNSWFNMT